MNGFSDRIEIYTFIIAGVVMAVIIIVFVLLVLLPRPSSDVKKDPGTVGLLGYPCSENKCVDGLVCDLNTALCKLPLGTPCSNFAECESSAYCSGVCSRGPSGGLYDCCPCNTGYVCVNVPLDITPTCIAPSTEGMKICLGAPGQNCTSGDQCSDGYCMNGTVACSGQTNCTCGTGTADGHPCSQNSDCGSKNCSDDFCQPPGITTGNVGAVCNPAPCGENVCSNGVCVAPTQGFGSFCSTRLICFPDQSCLGSNCNPSTSDCICEYNEQTINGYACTTNCIGSLVCSEEICRVNSGMGCSQTENFCLSGTCLVQNRLVNLDYQGLSIVGGSALVWNPISSSPINLQKIVSSGSNVLGFGTEPIAGLYIEAGGLWSQITIPTTGTVIDFAANDSTIYLATSTIMYSGSTTGNFRIFNPTSGPGPVGTQYTTGRTAITISSISCSLLGDILIIDPQGNYYVKPASAPYYTPGTTKVSGAQFYESTVAYVPVDPVTIGGCDIGRPLIIGDKFYPYDVNFNYESCSVSDQPIAYTVNQFNIHGNQISIIASSGPEEINQLYYVDTSFQLLVQAYVAKDVLTAIGSFTGGSSTIFLYYLGTCA